VVPPAVGLDDQPVLGPGEVHLESLDVAVDPGAGERGVVAQGEEALLEL